MQNNHIDYIELGATNLSEIKEFYTSVFGWEFTDFGDDYVAFKNSGTKGGFAKVSEVAKGGTLVVLYHEDLESIQADIEKAGGTISKEVFQFPGGKRFQFSDPAGNELAVWSDK